MIHDNIAEATIDMLKRLFRHARYGALLIVENNSEGWTFIVPALQITGIHVESNRLRIVYTSGSVDTFEFSKYTLRWVNGNDDLLIAEY